MLNCRQERLKIRLGAKHVVAINDGNVIVQYRHRGRLAPWGIPTTSRRGINPVTVVSIEVPFLSPLR
jgi:hypothetical protein